MTDAKTQQQTLTVELQNNTMNKFSSLRLYPIFFYHICSFKHIGSSLDESKADSVVSVFVTSRLDYTDSILYGTLLKNVTRLQHVQNALASLPLR